MREGSGGATPKALTQAQNAGRMGPLGPAGAEPYPHSASMKRFVKGRDRLGPPLGVAVCCWLLSVHLI
jgi:hypothetical protein